MARRLGFIDCAGIPEKLEPTRIPDEHGVHVVVEGHNDAEFLSRISHVLNRSNPAIPNLGDLERAGRLVFTPFGGTNRDKS